VTTDAILEERNVYQDAILESFDAHLRVMLATARANTIVRLRDSLSVTNGQIDLTADQLRDEGCINGSTEGHHDLGPWTIPASSQTHFKENNLNGTIGFDLRRIDFSYFAFSNFDRSIFLKCMRPCGVRQLARNTFHNTHNIF
jgi:hypothetical protein